MRIEIPLILGEGESLPQTGCAQISAPAGNLDPQFFPHDARVLVEMRGTPRILIVSPRAVTEPIVEFRVQLACSGNLARDYLLLAEPPRVQRPLTEPAPLPPETKQARQPEAPVTKSARREITPTATPAQPDTDRITLATDTTLNVMARKRYPADRRLRDEYRRLIVAANRDVFGDTPHPGAVPLPSGQTLDIPRSLPAPATGRATTLSAPTNATPASDATTRRKANDRLVIGGAPDGRMSTREALASVTRMEAMMEEQKQIEGRIDENLRAVNEALVATRERFQQMEAQQQKASREQRELRTRMEATDNKLSQMPSLLEMLVLVVGSGGVGATLLILHARLNRPKSLPLDDEFATPAPPPVRPVVAAAPPPAPPSAAAPPATAPRVPVPPAPAASTGSERTPSSPPPPAPSPAAVLDPPARAIAAVQVPREIEFNPPQPSEPSPAPKERKPATPILADLPTVPIGETIGLSGNKAATINRLLPQLPSLDVAAWFQAFDLLRGWSERKAFAALSLKMNEYINIEAPSWDPDLAAARTRLTDLKRITEKLLVLWRTGDHGLTKAFLIDLLTDNRGGTRNGFPEGVASDIGMLIGVLDILKQGDIPQPQLRRA